jgi:hypothetical protein
MVRTVSTHAMAPEHRRRGVRVGGVQFALYKIGRQGRHTAVLIIQGTSYFGNDDLDCEEAKIGWGRASRGVLVKEPPTTIRLHVHSLSETNLILFFLWMGISATVQSPQHIALRHVIDHIHKPSRGGFRTSLAYMESLESGRRLC